MNTINIILWTMSLTAAFIGIIFGIIASYNSKKANDKIKNILTVSFAAEEAQKLFFDRIQSAIISNKRAIKMLKEKITFENYSTESSQGRLVPLSNNSISILYKTEFKDLSIDYVNIKSRLDEIFFKIINEDTSIFLTNKLISSEMKKELLKYHEEVIKDAKIILTRYNQIIFFTREIKTNSKNKQN